MADGYNVTTADRYDDNGDEYDDACEGHADGPEMGVTFYWGEDCSL